MSWAGRAALAAGLMALAAPPASGQAVEARGRVVLVTEQDSQPLARHRVILHRVGRDWQGPLDSALTDARGAFRFRYATDTSAIFLLSAGYAGIEYFSLPLGRDDDAGPYTVVVHDTASSVPVRVTSRHVVVSRPGANGRRPVLEIVGLDNVGQRTRVGHDSTGPTWATPLPRGASDFQPGTGDFSPDAVIFRSDSVLLFGPISPGEKQLVYSYALPAGRSVVVPVVDSTDLLDVLVEERTGRVTGAGLVARDSQVVEGRSFLQWTAATPGRDSVIIRFVGRRLDTRLLLAAMVAVLGVILAVVARHLLRRRPTGPSSVDALVGRIAALDARFEGREAEVGADAWREYQAERASLKRELEARLATPPRHT